MNSVTMHGKLVSDAEKILVQTSGGETPLITFPMVDTGLPYQKSDPLIIEVHFIKEVANHIVDHLKKNKEVVVSGYLRQKKYILNGDLKTKIFISAEYVTLVPLFKDFKEKEAKNNGEN